MKKIIFLMMVAGYVSQASATALCAGASAAVNKPVTAADKFIKSNFQMPCSAKSYLDYDEDNGMAWAASASKGGACYIIGNTNGGAPRLAEPTCSPNKPDYTSSDTPAPSGKTDAAKQLGVS